MRKFEREEKKETVTRDKVREKKQQQGQKMRMCSRLRS